MLKIVGIDSNADWAVEFAIKNEENITNKAEHFGFDI